MFRKRLGLLKEGECHCRNRVKEFSLLGKDAIWYEETALYWENRIKIYGEGIQILGELQHDYDRCRGWWRRLLGMHINGTQRLGLELLSHQRLEHLTEPIRKKQGLGRC